MSINTIGTSSVQTVLNQAAVMRRMPSATRPRPSLMLPDRATLTTPTASPRERAMARARRRDDVRPDEGTEKSSLLEQVAEIRSGGDTNLDLQSFTSDVRAQIAAGKFQSQGRTRTENQYSDGTRRTETREMRRDGTRFLSLTTTDPEGKATGLSYNEVMNDDGRLSTYEYKGVDGRTIESRTTRPVKPDTDVPGLGFIGSYNPQDLVERLGPEDQITADETITRRQNPKGGFAEQKTTTMRSGDGKTELIQSAGPQGGNAWELREKNADGMWDSQTFLQGTEDTIIKKTRTEDGFTVEETKSKLPELAKSNKNIPAESNTTTRTADAASSEQVMRVLGKSTIGEIANTEAFKGFMNESVDSSFQVVSTDSEADGKKSSSFMMEAADGRKLAAVYDPEKKTYTVKTFDAEGETSGLAAITRTDDQMEKLEVSSDGKVTTSSAPLTGQIRNWVRTAEDVLTAPKQVTDGLRAVGRLDRALISAATPEQPGGSSSLLTDGKWAKRIGVGAGGAAALLSGMSLTADLMSGDYASAGRTAGTLGVDVATVAKSINADSFMNTASAGSRAGRWAMQGSRFLGAAGAAASLVFAGVDAYNGDYTRAGLGVASAGGAALALFGTASIAGPLGWGIAGAASLAMMANDYDNETQIAPYQLR